MQSEIYIVTVNYNNHKHTAQFLNSISELAIETLPRVVVVDNNSTVDDIHNLENTITKYENVVLLKNDCNAGYFRGLNIGIDYLREVYGFTGSDRVIVCNNDLKFRRDYFDKLLNIEYKEDELVIAPNIITNDGYHQNPLFIERVTKLRKIGYDLYYLNYYLGQTIYLLTQKYKQIRNPNYTNELNHRMHIYMAIGACYILTENYFRHFDKLDEQLFLMGEEVILSYQVNSVGGKILYEPELVVYHDESASINKIPSKQMYNIKKQSYKIYGKYYLLRNI